MGETITFAQQVEAQFPPRVYIQPPPPVGPNSLKEKLHRELEECKW